ncbi:Sporulation transcription regulator WhiA [compost metagenome]
MATKPLSFSQDVRSQLANLPPGKPCCERAMLLALFSVCGKDAAMMDGEPCLALAVDNAAVARLLFRLAKNAFSTPPHLASPGAGKGQAYRLFIPLNDEGLGRETSMDDLERQIKKRSCCRRAFLRGSFLGCGSVVDPERAYHLEFTAPGDVSVWIVDLLDAEGIRAGNYQRGGSGQWTAYVKKSEDIASFLTMIGAVQALLQFEEVLISRDLKNNVQRTVNCETANLERTVATAQSQITHLKALQTSKRLNELPSELQETAVLRIEHPYASLAQLAELHEPPLSKSAINHRLRKLLQVPVAESSDVPNL